MTKDFSNTRHLGFLRVIQFLFALNVVFTISTLVFMVKGDYTLDFDNYLDYFNLLLDAVSFWLIFRRKKAARWLIIAFSLFNIVIGSAFNIATDRFDFFEQLGACTFDIILFFYFLTSRRVKAVLVKPFNEETYEEDCAEERSLYQPKTWGFWRNLIIYFCVFSVVGHWMEAGYCTLIRFGLIPGIYDPNSQIWSDWLYPFLVYGAGAAACILILTPVKLALQKHFKRDLLPLVLSFLVGAILCSGIELAMGLMLNQPLPDGSLPLWDYRDMFCNFMGQICLQNALAFGFVATLMTWVIYPLLERLLSRFSRSTMTVIFIVIVVFFCILFFLYCINIVLPGID